MERGKNKMSRLILIVCFVVVCIVILGSRPSLADRDNMNQGKSCRDALSFSLLHKERIESFGHKFATDSDAKFIIQIILEDRSTRLIKAKCTGSLLHPQWVITSSDCGREFRLQTSDPSVIGFKVSTGVDFGDRHERVTASTFSSSSSSASSSYSSSSRDMHDVSSHFTLYEDLCSPLLLKLEKPIHHRSLVCLTPKSTFFHRNTEATLIRSLERSPSSLSKGLAIGWSTFGDTVVERNLRVTGVRIESKHCLERDENDGHLFCVNYPSQIHFYLLPGSALLSVKDTPGGHKEFFLEGLACTNLTSSFVNSSFIYRQTFLRLSYYLSTIQELTSGDVLSPSSGNRSSDSVASGREENFLSCLSFMLFAICFISRPSSSLMWL